MPLSRSVRALLSLFALLGLFVSVAPPAAAAPKLTAAALKSAPVPAMCFNKAGKLKNGKLPGVKFGYVQVRKTVSGQLSGDARSEVAAVIECSAGNAPFPHVVAIYTPDARGRAVMKGYVRLSSLGNLPGWVTKISISNKAVTVRWLDSSKRECTACATVSSQARIRVVRDKVTTDRVVKYTVNDAARSVASAVNSRKHSRVRAVTKTDSLATYLEGARRRHGKLRFNRCEAEQYATRSYICYFKQRNDAPLSIKIHHFGWKNWKVVGRWWEI